MLLISPTTSPIFCAPPASVLTMASVRLASSTALPAIVEDCATCLAISDIELDNSSAAEATVCTLTLACSTAAATPEACAVVWSVVLDSDCAVARNSVAAEATVPTSKPVLASKPRSKRIDLIAAPLPLDQQGLLIHRDGDVHVEHDAGSDRGNHRAQFTRRPAVGADGDIAKLAKYIVVAADVPARLQPDLVMHQADAMHAVVIAGVGAPVNKRCQC